MTDVAANVLATVVRDERWGRMVGDESGHVRCVPNDRPNALAEAYFELDERAERLTLELESCTQLLASLRLWLAFLDEGALSKIDEQLNRIAAA
jgi:hypothetical protein